MNEAIASLPEAYVSRIRAQLGADAESYLAAMEQPPLRGLRLNPQKPPDAPPSDLGAPVPWATDGYYLPCESTDGAHPLHEAGAYYLQEPSAMLPATLLAPRPGETVLDLCAAPGGKSTQLAALMNGRGLLVCNEPVPSRAQVLSRNLERMGVSNALAVSADPARLEPAWPALFDAVLVDAPCSGEGMFRRHPETRAEWEASAPARCAARQRLILESACGMLKPGGRLCYSTCTLNREENEEVIDALLRAHPELEPVDFTVPAGSGRTLASERGGLHLYPHQIAGEGHFVALLRKAGGETSARLLPPGEALAVPTREELAAWAAFWRGLSESPVPEANAKLGDTLLCAPPLPPLRGIKVLRAGVSLGRLRSGRFEPDHALAMRWPMPPLPTVALDEAGARAYQRGEALPAPVDLRGYALATHRGLALGFVKSSDGLLKNHYPKGLRRP